MQETEGEIDSTQAAADGELLRHFAGGRDQRAFAVLVERHAVMVRATARRVTGEETLADEASQAAFVLLAQKAGRLAVENAGPWLHRAAILCARNILRRERRETMKRAAFAMNPLAESSAQSDAEWTDVRPLLDEAIGQLPRRDQDAVVLRYLEGKSLAETGAAIGSNAEAVRQRLTRALVKLAGLLKRRGVALSLTGLMSGLAAENSSAGILPTAWIADVTRRVMGIPAPAAVPRWARLAPAAVFAAGWLLTAAFQPFRHDPEIASQKQTIGAATVAAGRRGPLDNHKPGWRVIRLRADISALMPDHNSAILLTGILTRLHALDSGELAELVKTLPVLASGRHTHFIAGQIFEQWAFLDPSAADAALRSLTTSESHWTEVAALFRGWIRKDREQAMARGLAPDESRRRFETSFRILAEFDMPDACRRMLEQIERGHPERGVGVQAIAYHSDETADPRFFEFLASIKEPELYWTALRTASGDAFEQVGSLGRHNRLMREHPEETINAIRCVADEAKRVRAFDVLMTAVAYEYGVSDPARGVRLLREMATDSPNLYCGWQTLALNWEATSPDGFSTWLAGLPDGPVRRAVETRPEKTGSSKIVFPPIRFQ